MTARTIPYLDSGCLMSLVRVLRANGYDYPSRAAIVGHVRQFGSAELCPAIREERHREEIAAALPGSFERWAAKARKAGR